MTKETECLLERIKNCLSDGSRVNEEDYEPFCEFVDKVKQAEGVLCRGGYIQDINGTPCKAGDRVRYYNSAHKGWEEGVLCWARDYTFIVKPSNAEVPIATPKWVSYSGCIEKIDD